MKNETIIRIIHNIILTPHQLYEIERLFINNPFLKKEIYIYVVGGNGIFYSWYSQPLVLAYHR